MDKAQREEIKNQKCMVEECAEEPINNSVHSERDKKTENPIQPNSSENEENKSSNTLDDKSERTKSSFFLDLPENKETSIEPGGYSISDSEREGHSKLSIIALILGILGCTSVVGLILAIVDIVKSKEDDYKHVCSWICVGFASFWLIAGIVFGFIKSGSSSDLAATTQSGVEMKDNRAAANEEQTVEVAEKELIEESETEEEAVTEGPQKDFSWIDDYISIASSWERTRLLEKGRGFALKYEEEDIPELILFGDYETEVYSYNDGMVLCTGSTIRGNIDTEANSENRRPYEEVLEELRGLRADADKERYPDTETWKLTYRNYMYDIMADAEYLGDFYEAFTYDENGRKAFFALKDITEDGIPELWITSNSDEQYRSWDVFTIGRDGKFDNLLDGRASIYDPDNKSIYGHTGGVSEHYTIYTLENGEMEKKYTFDEDDNYTIGYYRNDDKISKEEMDEYDRLYNEASQKYKGTIRGITLTRGNIDKELGFPANDIGLKEIEYTESKMNEILNDQSLFGDTSPGSLGYNWMWLKKRDEVRDNDYIYEFGCADNMVDKTLLYHLKKIDWDNDGIDEFCYCGDIAVEGLYFDMEGDILTAISGYGPYGMGWNDVAYFDDAYWVYSTSGNMGKIYEFERYNGDNRVEESFAYEWNIGEYMDEPSADEFYRYEGTDYDNKKEVSEEEFNKFCGENGIIYADLPEDLPNKDEEFTKKLYMAVKEFYEEKRPALSRFYGETGD